MCTFDHLMNAFVFVSLHFSMQPNEMNVICYVIRSIDLISLISFTIQRAVLTKEMYLSAASHQPASAAL